MSPKEIQYRFSFGPWNISEGADPYGPPTRPAKDFAWKLEQVKRIATTS
jgi:xylose isomerase